MTAPHTAPVPRTNTFRWSRMWTVGRTDLKQLLESTDFWVPMVLLGGFFFVRRARRSCSCDHRPGRQRGRRAAGVPGAASCCPQRPRTRCPRPPTPATKVSYVLAVYLFAPIAVIVPLTISTAVGASTIVGERERGTGEFLAHSPADVREIYLGKLIASLIPGYLTTARRLRPLLADGQPDRRPATSADGSSPRRRGGC